MEEITLDLGDYLVAKYRGRHRDVEMTKGVGFIPLGDRNRGRIGDAEERDSIDRYTKYTNRSNVPY